jgi:hypothetical protein
MYNLGMVMIGGSGGGPRASLFSSSVVDNFGLAGTFLGQSDAQQSYVKAKSGIGVSPEPEVIEKPVTVQGASTTSWAIPAVVMAGGFGVAAILGLFSGK